MLKRDLPFDYCEKYFEQPTKQSFYKEVQKDSMEKIFLTQDQVNRLSQQTQNITKKAQATVVASLVGFICFNKIPGIWKISSRFVRVCLRIGVLLGPSLAVSNMSIQKIQKLKHATFQQQASKYKDFLRSGDIKKLQQKIDFSDV